jgi:fructose-1,6-bisphosphatase II
MSPEQDTLNDRMEPVRLIGLEMVRATEAAALNTFPYIGRGDKLAADEAATDAIRGMLNLMDIRGLCTIGEGIKDEAPGIFVGEKLGTWRDKTPAVSIAIDPIDGTRPTTCGLQGALSVIAGAKTSEPDMNALAPVPSYYMYKIAVGPQVRDSVGHIRLDVPIGHTLEMIALALNKRVRDLCVCSLDRPRHDELFAQVRAAGASIRMIPDGDVSGAIAPCMPESGVDIYVGIGGSPEAVLAAAAIRCLGGEIMCRMWPRDEEERTRLIEEGHEDSLDRVYATEDLAKGDGIVFVATGITDGPFLKGVQIIGRRAITHSVVMRSYSHTVRWITAYHDLHYKTIKLHSHETPRKI